MTTPVAGDLYFFQSEEWSAASTNGGKLSTTQIVDNTLQNVWPHTLASQRTAGHTLYRKIFAKLHQDDATGYLSNAEFCLYGPTLGDDHILFFEGTNTDTQADWTIASERFYSAAGLNAQATAGSSTVVLALTDTDQEDAFQDGDKILISDKDDPDSSGNEELHEIDGTPVLAGSNLTITLLSTLTNTFAAYSAGSGGRVASILEYGTITPSHGTITQSRASTIDLTTYPMEWNNMGADEHTVTLTFTDATNFTASSDRFGALASGVITADYSPLHPTWAKALFTIPVEAWVPATTNQSGDTVGIPLHPAAAPLVLYRDTPAGASAVSSNKIILFEMVEGI